MMKWEKIKTWPVVRLFSKQEEQQTVEQIEHARQLKRLSDWLEKLPDILDSNVADSLKGVDIDSYISNLKMHKNLFKLMRENGQTMLSSACHQIDVDSSQFSKEELASLAPQFNAVHNWAVDYNVKLDFSGFDHMPRKYGEQGPRTTIIVDLENTYDIMRHPELSASREDRLTLEGRLNSKFKQNQLKNH